MLGIGTTCFTLLLGSFVCGDRGNKPLRDKRTTHGYFPVCPPGCATCSTLNGCVSCRQGRYLLLHRDGARQVAHCVRACPRGYYPLRQPRLSSCHQCSIPNCEACFNKTYCTQCVPPFMSFKGQCIDQCPPGLFYANYKKECLAKVDCAAGPWGPWAACTRRQRTCGYKYGAHTRRRLPLQQPSPNGAPCPPLVEADTCRLPRRYCADIKDNSSDPQLDNSISNRELIGTLFKTLVSTPVSSKRRISERDRRRQKKPRRKCDRKCRRRRRRRKRKRRKRRKEREKKRQKHLAERSLQEHGLLPSTKTNEIFPLQME